MKGIQDTSNKTYRQLMGNGLRYEIPKFQRDYSWETEQWDDLWFDLMSLIENEEIEHYMGYLVLQTSNNKNFSIIDGQQRLTTMSLLILSVLKCLDDLVNQDIDRDDNLIRKETLLNSYIGYVNPVTLISDNKIKLNRNSDDYYRQHLVLLKDLPIRNTNSSEKQMRSCFEWFYDKVRKQFKNGVELASFIDTIVDKISFTVIEVTDQLNAFKVFETLNARGVQLSSSDLLKNHLFSLVDETNPHVSEIEELEKLWSKVIGKLSSNKFEDYLRYYWNSRNKIVRKNNLFKTIKKTIINKAQAFELIRELDKNADVFIAIQNPNDVLWENKNELIKALEELKLFQVRQTFSLFLIGYQNLAIENFIKLVKYCSVISFRYNVISGLNPNELEDVYNKLALEIKEKHNFSLDLLKSIYVSDNDFEQSFSSKSFKRTTRNHKIVKYIFGSIERKIFANDIPYDSDIYTIEHILPENPNNDWYQFSDEEINRSIFRIGNLTLLEKSLNKDVENSSFELKKQYLIKSNSKLTQKLCQENETWTESKIISRQKELARYAKSVWRIQQLE
ncbi:DUF262 domain-containing HNH endonuclease family protein [Flavobacterium sp. CBA20B-1]|uniref:DUF262 domain-containing protein n=1 Tax=unclassified Flavobacterium TaxID=196869 RepID=UPI0022256D90|nr:MULTISPECIES: DUF262 domain-containing HNH endonuclease family protein [unclassified Flavobacterium]WCM40803.1 DUF262 domain-containing HNH endonuclease family protein [Flavobacterium sp. CBA20B-1]